MELKEIKEIVSEILYDIDKNQQNLTYRKYDTFLERIGMGKKRNFTILNKFDYQFKKQNLSLWCGKDESKQIARFKKGDLVTFRLNENSKGSEPEKINKQISNEFARKIIINDTESRINLFPHQEQAIYSLQQKITKTNKNPFAGLLVLPTGGGKTLTAAHWICKNYLDKGKKVLWIAHRHELLEQAKNTFVDKLSFNDIFQTKKSFNYRIISGNHDKPINIRATDDLIISSKDSLNLGFDHLKNKWIKNYSDEIFLVIDEAHHATAKTYRNLIKNIQENVSHFQMLGLTATPFRTSDDEKGLLAKVFPDDIIYKIDLRTLIRLGILSEPHFEEVSTGLNFIKGLDDEQIKNLNYFGMEKSIGTAIAKTIAENSDRNHLIVQRYLTNKSKYKQTIVFALNVDNAIALNALFKEVGIKSDFVVSNLKDQVTGVTTSSEENKEKIARFRNEEIQVLINVNILTEGTDVPNVQSIFLARPTISTILMTQMIGRGLRGLKAKGTKEAYIVSFIDDWQNQISWVNPQKLFIEDNIDFNDKEIDRETKNSFFRLIAINKIEEFAILSNKIIEPEIREELEKLNFIERLPVGIYKFRYIEHRVGETIDRNCEVLVYDNLSHAYKDFVTSLPDFFQEKNLTDKDILTENELEDLAGQIQIEFFDDTLKYPAYDIKDIKNILQYYAIQGETPPFIEFEDRYKFDIDVLAKEIIEKDLGEKSQVEFINKTWESNEIAWQTFFDIEQKKEFIREIDLAKRRISYPEHFYRKPIMTQEEKELRNYEEESMKILRKEDPVYEEWLRNEVFKKFTDKDGYFYCALTGYKSKRRRDFEVDHIIPMNPKLGDKGLTVLENLQLLRSKENRKKGNKI